MKRYQWIIIAVVSLAALVTSEVALHRRTIPPNTVTDIASFLHWKPTTTSFEVIHNGKGECLLARGSGGSLMPSGPSGYIFDRSGRLVDWSSDVGDDNRFQSKWKLYPSIRQIPASGAAAWANDGTPVSG